MSVGSSGETQVGAVVLVRGDSRPLRKVCVTFLSHRWWGTRQKTIVSFASFHCVNWLAETQEAVMVSRAAVSAGNLARLPWRDRSRTVFVTAHTWNSGPVYQAATSLGDLLEALQTGEGSEAILCFTLSGGVAEEGAHESPFLAYFRRGEQDRVGGVLLRYPDGEGLQHAAGGQHCGALPLGGQQEAPKAPFCAKVEHDRPRELAGATQHCEQPRQTHPRRPARGRRGPQRERHELRQGEGQRQAGGARRGAQGTPPHQAPDAFPEGRALSLLRSLLCGLVCGGITGCLAASLCSDWRWSFP